MKSGKVEETEMKRIFGKHAARCLLLCLSAVILLQQIPAWAVETENQKSLLIMLDISGSMGKNDSEKSAIDWARGLYAMCTGLGIRTDIMTFGNEAKILKGMPQQDEMEYKDDKTDHLTAIRQVKPGGYSAVVMLSDGTLDLLGRDVKNIPSDEPRTDDECRAIDDFVAEGKELRQQGCQMLLVGFGKESAEEKELYDLDGFRMFQELDNKANCRFINATEFRNMDINRYVLQMFGLDCKEVWDDIGFSDGVIQFRLDKPYYKCGLCINKKLEYKGGVPVTEDEVRIQKDGNPYGGLSGQIYDVKNYPDFVFLRLDQPEAGEYEIKLPHHLDNEYRIIFQGYVDTLPPEIELYRDNRDSKELLLPDNQDRQDNERQHYTVREDDTCFLKLKMYTDQVTSENIRDFKFDIYLQDGFLVQSSSGLTRTDTFWEITGLTSGDVAETTEDSQESASSQAKTYIIQASLIVNDEPMKIDPVEVTVTGSESDDIPQYCYTVKVEKWVSIVPAELSENISKRPQDIFYSVEKVNEDGDAFPTSAYKETNNQIAFEEKGVYILKVAEYEPDNIVMKIQYTVTPFSPCIILGAIIFIAVAVIGFVLLVRSKHKS